PGCREARPERRQQRGTAGRSAQREPASNRRGRQLAQAKGLFWRSLWLLKPDVLELDLQDATPGPDRRNLKALSLWGYDHSRRFQRVAHDRARRVRCNPRPFGFG